MSLTKETSSSDLFRLMCEACRLVTRLSVREFPNISVCRASKGTGVVEHTQVVLDKIVADRPLSCESF